LEGFVRVFSPAYVLRTPKGFLENHKVFPEREKPIKVFWNQKGFGVKNPSQGFSRNLMVFHSYMYENPPFRVSKKPLGVLNVCFVKNPPSNRMTECFCLVLPIQSTRCGEGEKCEPMFSCAPRPCPGGYMLRCVPDYNCKYR
jgi:hypothetical protein